MLQKTRIESFINCPKFIHLQQNWKPLFSFFKSLWLHFVSLAFNLWNPYITYDQRSRGQPTEVVAHVWHSASKDGHLSFRGDEKTDEKKFFLVWEIVYVTQFILCHCEKNAKKFFFQFFWSFKKNFITFKKLFLILD